jgi:hypothetical protein
MQHTSTRFTRFDFDVITDPVDPQPIAKPSAASSGGKATTAGSPEPKSTDATKPAI